VGADGGELALFQLAAALCQLPIPFPWLTVRPLAWLRSGAGTGSERGAGRGAGTRALPHNFPVSQEPDDGGTWPGSRDRTWRGTWPRLYQGRVGGDQPEGLEAAQGTLNGPPVMP